VLAGFEASRVKSLEPEHLRMCLAVAVRELLREGMAAGVPIAGEVEVRLAEIRG
jgi:hypothetical protein